MRKTGVIDLFLVLDPVSALHTHLPLNVIPLVHGLSPGWICPVFLIEESVLSATWLWFCWPSYKDFFFIRTHVVLIIVAYFMPECQSATANIFQLILIQKQNFYAFLGSILFQKSGILCSGITGIVYSGMVA